MLPDFGASVCSLWFIELQYSDIPCEKNSQFYSTEVMGRGWAAWCWQWDLIGSPKTVMWLFAQLRGDKYMHTLLDDLKHTQNSIEIHLTFTAVLINILVVNLPSNLAYN